MLVISVYTTFRIFNFFANTIFFQFGQVQNPCIEILPLIFPLQSVTELHFLRLVILATENSRVWDPVIENFACAFTYRKGKKSITG